MAKEVAKQLKRRVDQRFPKYGTDNHLHCLGNYLDPKFRGVHLELVDELESTKSLLKLQWDEVQDEVLGKKNLPRAMGAISLLGFFEKEGCVTDVASEPTLGE